MAAVATPDVAQDLRSGVSPVFTTPWQTVVWNDPVNLMTYVTRVFREYFGFTEERATERMMAVHSEGRAVVAEGAREQMELHVQAMHDYGLWATVQRADA